VQIWPRTIRARKGQLRGNPALGSASIGRGRAPGSWAVLRQTPFIDKGCLRGTRSLVLSNFQRYKIMRIKTTVFSDASNLNTCVAVDLSATPTVRLGQRTGNGPFCHEADEDSFYRHHCVLQRTSLLSTRPTVVVADLAQFRTRPDEDSFYHRCVLRRTIYDLSLAFLPSRFLPTLHLIHHK
jgi:hypothetical protein